MSSKRIGRQLGFDIQNEAVQNNHRHNLNEMTEMNEMNDMTDTVSSFDLEAYAARYHGRGKIQRLRYIAEKSRDLSKDSLRLAINESMKGRDSVLYKQLMAYGQKTFGGSNGKRGNTSQQQQNEYELNETWIRNVDQWASKQLDKLRQDLEENKQHENKEVTRTGHNDLGDFFHERGRLQQARGEYIKTRDYCMHASHNLEMCLKVILISIECGDYAHVESHFMIAENIPDIDKTRDELAKMRACTGLSMMHMGEYMQAAMYLLRTNLHAHEDKISSLQECFGDVMSLEDVVIYGGLCALATFDRFTLSRMIIDKVEFRNLLELVPDMREIIFDFYHTRYTRCLQTLNKIKPELLLDVHLGTNNHVGHLYTMIRRKALVQYVSPFVTCDLSRMQDVFATCRAELERELLTLIENGDISARIDTQSHALHAKNVNVRTNALRTSIQKGRDAFNDAEATLLRMTMLKHGLEINVGGINSDTGGGGSGGLGGSMNNHNLQHHGGHGPSLGRRRGGSMNSVVDGMFDGHFAS